MRDSRLGSDGTADFIKMLEPDITEIGNRVSSTVQSFSMASRTGYEVA